MRINYMRACILPEEIKSNDRVKVKRILEHLPLKSVR